MAPSSPNKASINTVPSLDEADDLFKTLASDESLAFGHPQDGCFARAFFVCESLKTAGYAPKKVWALCGEEKLSVKFPDGRSFRWDYHVAAALPVKLLHGEVQDFVFDPSVSKNALPVAEWAEQLHASMKKVFVTPLGVAPELEKGDYDLDHKTSAVLSDPSLVDINPHVVRERFKELPTISYAVFERRYKEEDKIPSSPTSAGGGPVSPKREQVTPTTKQASLFDSYNL